MFDDSNSIVERSDVSLNDGHSGNERRDNRGENRDVSFADSYSGGERGDTISIIATLTVMLSLIVAIDGVQ